MPAPVEVEPPRICVDLNGDTMFRARFKNPFDIDVKARPAQELPPGHVPKDGGVGICDGADNALCLRLAIHLELPVNACDDEIKAPKHVLRIIERSVRQDVRLDPFENTKPTAVLPVECIRVLLLLRDLPNAQPTLRNARTSNDPRHQNTGSRGFAWLRP